MPRSQSAARVLPLVVAAALGLGRVTPAEVSPAEVSPAEASPTQASPPHDKAFWQAVARNKFAVPPGESVDALARELSALLASPDPELRDDIAYSGLATWMYRERVLSRPTLQSLADQWYRNLSTGLGERGTDSVFVRSFSALSLGIVAALDNDAPFMEREQFERLLVAALAYFEAERDIRGFDPDRGWIHTVAHTADLLKFLGRSRHLRLPEQAAILSAMSRKLAGLDDVLIHGEDERLARAVVSIAARPDFDESGFGLWLASLKPAAAGAPTPSSLAVGQNRKNLVVSLHAVLTTETRQLPGLQSARAMAGDALKSFVR